MRLARAPLQIIFHFLLAEPSFLHLESVLLLLRYDHSDLCQELLLRWVPGLVGCMIWALLIGCLHEPSCFLEIAIQEQLCHLILVPTGPVLADFSGHVEIFSSNLWLHHPENPSSCSQSQSLLPTS